MIPHAESELLSRIRNKDKKAFEELYKSCFKRLFILSYQYVKDEEVAEEIVNDTLMKIWTEASRLTISNSFKAYLNRSVVNRSLNFIRQQQTEKTRADVYKQQLPLLDSEEEDSAVLESRLLLIEDILESLPPQCKKIMMMSKFERCKQQEIANRLDISIKTVKNQLTIGLEKIRKAFASLPENLISITLVLLSISDLITHVQI